MDATQRCDECRGQGIVKYGGDPIRCRGCNGSGYAKQVVPRTEWVVAGQVYATLGDARLRRDFIVSRGGNIRDLFPIIKRTITEEEVE